MHQTTLCLLSGLSILCLKDRELDYESEGYKWECPKTSSCGVSNPYYVIFELSPTLMSSSGVTFWILNSSVMSASPQTPTKTSSWVVKSRQIYMNQIKPELKSCFKIWAPILPNQKLLWNFWKTCRRTDTVCGNLVGFRSYHIFVQLWQRNYVIWLEIKLNVRWNFSESLL